MSIERTIQKPQHILVVDDDEDDCLLMREAFAEVRPQSPLSFVHDGEQLMAYLMRSAPYEDAERCPMPDMILLDLNMPRMDGREALRAIKQHATLRCIPVIVLTTSSACEDVKSSYDCGANSFVTKPTSFSDLKRLVVTLGDYWLELVTLPPSPWIREA
ncbi:response regulator [uncultured Halopseudomonas sp.]|jgi:CheY-like chemotaxis protein|uniref:response regulator n=1 Tax=uncultured Halopseudomonas sp. TaxID=2901193 RepID=UPI0030EB513D|tara:strand:+ start:8418 stop:8894 length:477 start_codon:yes stop_codon:yes gene_type:complete